MCRNVKIVYLGEGPYPGQLPPEGCYELMPVEEGLALWRTRVADWHARHPDVAADRKVEAMYGDVTFPRPPFNQP